MKRYIFLVVAVALATVSCSKTYDTNLNAAKTGAIGFGTWSDVLTRAPMTAFADGNEFDVFGYKWKGSFASPTNPTDVFNGDDVKYNGSTWSYENPRFWDVNFDGYTFFAVYPKDKLTTAPVQTGLFVTNELTFDGATEPLLIAQRKTVNKGGAPYFNNYAAVPLVFKHMSALVDLKVRKVEAIKGAVLEVTGITLNNIQTKGKFTVASYSGDNDPVGSAGAGGWELAATPVPANFTNASGSGVASLPTLAANSGYDKAGAGDLISELVVMPQIFTVGGQSLTIEYTLTSGGDATEHTVTVDLRDFDEVENAVNTDTTIPSWLPGVHYTYYLIIDANAISFTASVASWDVEKDGYYYLLN